jgi:hypothetical protein
VQRRRRLRVAGPSHSSLFFVPPSPLRCYPSRKEDGAFQWDYGKPWTYCRDSETYTDPTYSDSCSGCKFHRNPNHASRALSPFASLTLSFALALLDNRGGICLLHIERDLRRSRVGAAGQLPGLMQVVRSGRCDAVPDVFPGHIEPNREPNREPNPLSYLESHLEPDHEPHPLSVPEPHHRAC